MQHPAIQDCAVIGLPDDKCGERVTAVVQLRATHRHDDAFFIRLVQLALNTGPNGI
jgi:acyl-coenzyme A synthetase/AMP-(fatty) acid ligase